MSAKLKKIDYVWINQAGKFAQIRPVSGHGTFVYWGEKVNGRNVICKQVFKGYKAVPYATLHLLRLGFKPWMPLIEID